MIKYCLYDKVERDLGAGKVSSRIEEFPVTVEKSPYDARELPSMLRGNSPIL